MVTTIPDVPGPLDSVGLYAEAEPPFFFEDDTSERNSLGLVELPPLVPGTCFYLYRSSLSDKNS